MFLTAVQGLIDFFDPAEKAVKTPPPRKGSTIKTNLSDDLKPGDIILYRWESEKDFLGGMIGYFTSSPYSHAEIHIHDGYDISAGAGGVTFKDLYKQNWAVDVFRIKNLEANQEKALEAAAMKALLMPYDVVDLFTFPFMTAKEAIKRARNKAYICSELVVHCARQAGHELVKGVSSIEAPADIAHSDDIDYVGTYIHGFKQGENLRNKLLVTQKYTRMEEFLGNFVDKFSTRDEYYKALAVNIVR